jgi:hypothetical protein
MEYSVADYNNTSKMGWARCLYGGDEECIQNFGGETSWKNITFYSPQKQIKL